MADTESNSPKLTWDFLIISFIVIACAGFGVYANSMNGDFLWDDESLVQFNPYIKDWSHLGKIMTSRLGSVAMEAGAFYRPVQMLSYLVDYSFWRLNPFGYHLTNVSWHVLTAFSVFGLVQVLFRIRSLSFLTALFFVIHPIHTEAVSYIAGRADSLSAFFMYCAFILYIVHSTNKGLKIIGGMAACFLLSLLSKELALILPVLILFYHGTFDKPLDKKAFSVLVGTVIFYGLWRLIVVGSAAIATGETPSFFARLPGVLVALTSYIRLLLMPFDLHMEYGGKLFSFGEPAAIVGVVILLVMADFVRKDRGRNLFTYFAVGWFLITLFPSSNIVIAINAYMAEHWLYIPSVGFFLILARIMTQLYGRERLRAMAVLMTCGFLVFYSSLTVMQNRYWKDDINLYKRMLNYAPDSSRLYNNLAKAYHDAGMNEELIALLVSAIKLEPDNVLAHNNLGNAYKGIGKYEEAKRAYREAIRLDPNHAGPYYNLSTIYADVDKNLPEAQRLLEKAIEISPFFAKSYNKLGLIYMERGETDKAVELLNRALSLNPDEPEIYHAFGYIYMQSGDIVNSIEMYRKAIEVDPRYAEAYHDLAIIYSSAGDFQKAIFYCDHAVALGYVDQRLLALLKPYR